jgi:hypothetical protein
LQLGFLVDFKQTKKTLKWSALVVIHIRYLFNLKSPEISNPKIIIMKRFFLFTVLGFMLTGLFLSGCSDDMPEPWKEHPVWYKDSDGDGKGDPQIYVYSEVQPVGFVSNNDDLNDNLPCDEALIFYRDKDGDGLGDPNDSIEACSAPDGYVDNDDDVDDSAS